MNYLGRVLSFKEACSYLGLSKSYLYKLTSSDIIPFSKPNGKKIYFDREKLDEWMLGKPNVTLAEREINAATYISCNK